MYFMPFAYGDSSLTASQRKNIGSAAKENNLRVAAIMENTLQRGIATAVGWFVPGLKVFATNDRDLRRAYDFVDAPGLARVRLTIVELHRETQAPVPPVLPD